MYRRILLATDSSREGLIALREGALLAAMYRAEVFLLVIDIETAGHRMANGVHPLPAHESGKELLELGLSRLRRMTLTASGQTAAGEPAQLIQISAERFQADLVVVGHRRRNILDRWWSGASGAYLVDTVACSVLIARNFVGDEDFNARVEAMAARSGDA